MILFVLPFFYRSGMPVSLSLAVAFIGYQLIFHWREAVSWQSVVPVAFAMIFIALWLIVRRTRLSLALSERLAPSHPPADDGPQLVAGVDG